MKKQTKIKKKKLSIKQERFAIDYVKTGNATEAIVKNYKVKDRIVAKSMGAENLTKPYIKERVDSIANRIPDELLVQKHLELLNVPKVKRSIRKGVVVEEEESLDSAAIKAGLDMAYKIKGTYKAEQHDIQFAGYDKEQLVDFIISKIVNKK